MHLKSIQHILLVLFFSLYFSFGTVVIASNNSSTSINLYSTANSATKNSQAIMLYFSATYCTYCMQLNEDVIHPMQINEGYIKKVKVVEVSLDGAEKIIDFNNKAINSDDLQSRYNIQVTPTLVFVDQKGNEISQRIVGYQTIDFYWYYLDESINKALAGP